MARIYIVDDHTIVRDGLRGVLTAAGHQVVGDAASAEQARAELPALAPDLLLLDLQLGGRGGLTLLAELQALGHAPPTLVLTMSSSAGDLAAARLLGAAGYLLKDVSRSVLLDSITTVLAGGRVLARPPVAESPAPPLAAQLSARELQIMLCVVQGGSSQAIAERLGLSPKTVDTYRSRLMHKLGVADVTALVRLAVRAGLIDRAP